MLPNVYNSNSHIYYVHKNYCHIICKHEFYYENLTNTGLHICIINLDLIKNDNTVTFTDGILIEMTDKHYCIKTENSRATFDSGMTKPSYFMDHEELTEFKRGRSICFLYPNYQICLQTLNVINLLGFTFIKSHNKPVGNVKFRDYSMDVEYLYLNYGSHKIDLRNLFGSSYDDFTQKCRIYIYMQIIITYIKSVVIYLVSL